MTKRPTPPPIPPLPLNVLVVLERIEGFAADALKRSSNPVSMTTNVEKAKRVLHTCLVETLDVQLNYYASLPNYCQDWEKELTINTVKSIIGLFPLFISARPFVSDLFDRAREYMADRMKTTKGTEAQDTVQVDRKELCNSYRTKFPEVKILDICWAAGQHYSELKRWLRDAVKDGSAPDRAFRSILASGKSPQEYRKQRRPDGWK
jgi:hypothetical protein